MYPSLIDGESSIHKLYLQNFLQSKRSIYIESQHPGEYYLLNALKHLLNIKNKNKETFNVICILPLQMMGAIRSAKKHSDIYQKQLKEQKQHNNSNDNNNNQQTV